MLVRSPKQVDKLADLLSDDNCEEYEGSVSEDVGGSALISVDTEQLDCTEL